MMFLLQSHPFLACLRRQLIPLTLSSISAVNLFHVVKGFKGKKFYIFKLNVKWMSFGTLILNIRMIIIFFNYKSKSLWLLLLLGELYFASGIDGSIG